MGFSLFYPYVLSYISSTFVPDPWLANISQHLVVTTAPLEQAPQILRFLAFFSSWEKLSYTMWVYKRETVANAGTWSILLVCSVFPL